MEIWAFENGGRVFGRRAGRATWKEELSVVEVLGEKSCIRASSLPENRVCIESRKIRLSPKGDRVDPNGPVDHVTPFDSIIQVNHTVRSCVAWVPGYQHCLQPMATRKL